MTQAFILHPSTTKPHHRRKATIPIRTCITRASHKPLQPPHLPPPKSNPSKSIPLPSPAHLLPFLPLPLASLAEPETPTDDLITAASQNDSLSARILGTIVLLMLVYASIGVVIITVDSWIVKRNDKRNRADIEKIVADNPGIKFLSQAKKGAVKEAVLSGANRQQRRVEKKIKEKESREKKKKEQRAAARSDGEGK